MMCNRLLSSPGHCNVAVRERLQVSSLTLITRQATHAHTNAARTSFDALVNVVTDACHTGVVERVTKWIECPTNMAEVSSNVQSVRHGNSAGHGTLAPV